MALTDEQRKRYDDYFAAPAPQQKNVNNAAPAAPAQPAQMSQADAEYNAYLASRGMAPEPALQPAASQEDGFLGSAYKGFKSGVAGVAGGLAGLAGKNAVTDYLDDVEQSNRRAKDFDTVFSWDYITDPSGLTYDVANQAGSMAGLGVATKAALALAPGAVVAAPALKLLTTARKLGTPGRWVAKKLGKEGVTNLVEGAFTAIPEAFSEGGQTIKELDEQGDPDKYWKGAGVIGKNLALLPLTNAIEWGAVTGGLKGAMGKAGESIVTRVAKAPYRAAGPAGLSALMNGIEEFEQTTFTNQAKGQDISALDLFQPSKWDDERRQALEVGALGSLVMAGIPGMARSAQVEQQKQNGKDNLSDYEKLVAQVADETIQKNRAINEVLGSSDRFSNIQFNDADEEITAEFERRGGRIVPNGVIYRDGKLYKGSDYGVNWYENFEEMSADELEEWKNDRLEDLADTANMPELQGNYFFSNEANAEYLQHIDQLIAMKRQKEAKEGKKAEGKPATNGAVPPSTPPAAPRPKEVQDSPLGRSPQDPAIPQEYADAMEAEEAAQAENAPKQQPAPQVEVPKNLLDLGRRALVDGDPDALTAFGFLRPEMQQAIQDAIQEQLRGEAMQGRGNAANAPKGQAAAPQQEAGKAPVPTGQTQTATDNSGQQMPSNPQPAATPVTGEAGANGVATEPKRNPVTEQPETNAPSATPEAAAGQPQGQAPQGQPVTGAATEGTAPAEQRSPYFDQGVAIAKKDGGVSKASLKKQLKIGDDKANKLIRDLQDAGIVSREMDKKTKKFPYIGKGEENDGETPQVSQPATEEGGNQDVNAQPGQVGTQEGQNGEGVEDQSEAEVAATPKQPVAEQPAAEPAAPQAEPETEEAPEETAANPEEEPAAEEGTKETYETEHFNADMFEHTKTKRMIPRAGLKDKISDEQFKAISQIAKKYHGKWSGKQFANGFLFYVSKETPHPLESRAAFIKEAEEYLGGSSGGAATETSAAPVQTPAPEPVATPAAPESKPTPKPEPKAEPKPEPKAEPKTDPQTQPETKTRPETTPQIEPSAKPGPKPETKTETEEFGSEADAIDEMDALLGVKNPEPYNPNADNETETTDKVDVGNAFDDVSDTRAQDLINAIKNGGKLNKITSFNKVVNFSKESETKEAPAQETKAEGTKTTKTTPAQQSKATEETKAPKFDGELMTQLLEVGGYYIKNGKNNFADFEKQFLADFGEKVRPYIKAVWEMIRVYPKNRKFDAKTALACIKYVGSKLQNGQKIEDIKKEFGHRYGEEHLPLVEVGHMGYNTFKGINPNAMQGVPEGTVVGAEEETYEADGGDGAWNPWILTNPETGELVPGARNLVRKAKGQTEFKIISGMARKWDGIYSPEEQGFIFPASSWRAAVRNRNEFLADANDFIGAKMIEKGEEDAGTDNDGLQGVDEEIPPGTVRPDGETGDAGQPLLGTGGEGEGVPGSGVGQPRNPSGTEGGTGEDVSGEPRNGDGDTATGRGDGDSVSVWNGLSDSLLDSDQSATPGGDFLILADNNGKYQETSVIEKAKKNVEAVRLLNQLDAAGRMATPAEQAILAQYSGWAETSNTPTSLLFNEIGEDQVQDYVNENTTEDDVYEIIGLQEDLKKALDYDTESADSENNLYLAAKKEAEEKDTFVPLELASKLWEVLDKLGFKGGRILAPHMHGNELFTAMPVEVRSRSALSGVENNQLYARLAKQLFQKAYTLQDRFAFSAMPKNFYDLALGVFNKEDVEGRYYDSNYNFINYIETELEKLFDSTREDGVVVVIAPTKLMDDKMVSSIRLKASLKDQAKLLGAVRMPALMDIDKTGKQTTITQDLLIFQKHTLKGTEKGVDFFDYNHNYGTDTYGINNFLAFSKNATIVGNKGVGINNSYRQADSHSFDDVKAALDNMVKQIQLQLGENKKNLYEEPVYQQQSNAPAASKSYLKNIGNRPGSFVVVGEGKDASVGYKDGDQFVKVTNRNKGQEKAKAYIPLRDTTKEYLQAQLDPEISDEELEKKRKELKSLFDDFVKKFGPVHDKKTKNILRNDPDFDFVAALEKYSVDLLTGEATTGPSDLLLRRTVNPIAERQMPETAKEALGEVLDRRGVVDIDWISEVLEKTPKEVVKELEGTLIFRNPETQQFELAEEYLSGPIGAKIKVAEAAAERVNPVYKKNVEALKKVQVKPITKPDSEEEKITTRIGSSWIPARYYVDFMNSKYNAYMDVFNIHFIPETGDWIVNWTNNGYGAYHSSEREIRSGEGYNKITYEILGTRRHDARYIIQAALNQQTDFDFKEIDNDWKSIPGTVDEEEIRLVQTKIEELQNAFQDWIWEDENRRTDLLAIYNAKFRDWTLREWKDAGKDLTLPGYDNSPNKILRTHQKDGLARIVFSPYNVYIAHCVGAGKTWTMQAAMMKMRELGIARKGMFVSPNLTMALQFKEDWNKIFPNANLLLVQAEDVPEIDAMPGDLAEIIAATRRNGDKEAAKRLEEDYYQKNNEKYAKRKATLEKIANEDWDGIIITPEAFERIGMSLSSSLNEREARISELERLYARIDLSQDLFEEAAEKNAFLGKINKEIRSIITSELKSIAKADPTLEQEIAERFWQKIPKDPRRKPKSKKDYVTRFSRMSIGDLRTAISEYMEQIPEIDKKRLVIPFEGLGIDRLFVDEADNYKNLQISTRMKNIGGLNTGRDTPSARDMYNKARYISSINNGKGVCFASGTPITNSLGEMFVTLMQLDADAMRERAVDQFDLWAPTFANHEPVVEPNPNGNGLRIKERFTSFVNSGELLTMFRKVADVKTSDELEIETPELEGGKAQEIVVKPSQALLDYIKNEIGPRAEAIKNGQPLRDGDNMLVISTDLRKAALDMRLVKPNLKGEEVNQKLVAVADEIFKDYVASDSVKGAQAVFMNLSVPKNKIENGAADSSQAQKEDAGFDALADNPLALKQGKSNFSAYTELKQMLIDRGIPENEIAFIYDAKNDDDKAKLLEMVNRGVIRVIIGSVEKMGVGNNFQKKLYTLHEVTPPYRPREIEQGRGRIKRQGNENKTIRIKTYITEQSADAIMWSILKRKATMINQAMSGNLEQRTIEDVDAVAVDFATCQALATGDPVVAQYIMDDARLTKLQGARNSHESSKRGAKEGLEAIEKELGPLNTQIEKIQSDYDARPDLSGKNFKMSIQGKEYTDKKEAEDAFNKLVERFNGDSNSPDTVGEIGGFKIGLTTVWGFKADEKTGHNVAVKENTVYLIGNLHYRGGIKGFGSLMSLYEKGIKKRLDDLKDSRELKETQKKAFEDELSRPFEKEAEYQELVKKVDEEERHLGLGRYATQNVAPTLGQATQAAQSSTDDNDIQAQVFKRHKAKDSTARREIADLVNEVQSAFRGAKDVRYTGDRIVFTMPNERRISVVLKDHVYVSGKEAESARKAHGLKGTGEKLEIQGYSQRIGENSLILLSQYSETGTAFHEAFHTVWDLVLTAKEQAALVKHYKSRTINGEAVTETIANAYRDWLIDRRRQRSSLFGKLWLKIKDFVDGALNFLVNIKGTENVFRQIENGRVWNRQGRHSKGAINKGVRNYMVGGELAKTANKEILAKAKQMYEEGYTDQEIWDETRKLGQGWWIGEDLKWRFEIPDEYKYIVKDKLPKNRDDIKTYGEVYTNPAIYEAYPQLKSKKLVGDYLDTDCFGGTDDNGNVVLNIMNYDSPVEKTRFETYNTIFHEGQHSIQMIEGFAAGGADDTVFDKITNEISKLETIARSIDPAATTYYNCISAYDDAVYNEDEKRINETREDLLIFNRRNPHLTKEQKKRIVTLIDRAVKLQYMLKKYKKNMFFGQYETYKKLGGEEEARWVAERAKVRAGELRDARRRRKYKGDDSLPLMKKVPRTQPRSSILVFDGATAGLNKANGTQLSVTETKDEAKQSIDELVKEVSSAFPNAKDVQFKDNSLYFTMPNGVKMQVELVGQITDSSMDEDEAKKSHGLASEGEVVIGGLHKKLGKGSYIALSQEGSKGTAYHEAFHAARAWVLNKKENAALEKHFRDEAKASGADAEELMAEAYRKWQIARKQHKGTMFGKLFQKIQDFAYKALAIITKAENVHNVMRKIAEGEVWNRDAQGRFTGGKTQYSLSSAIDTGLNKAESYVNRNVRKPNAKTAEGRTAAIFNNTHNKNDAQTWVAWLKNKKDKFYREWVDKNDALHQLDEFLENAGGKKLNESEKIYNQVQVARALSNGSAQTLVSGNEQSFRALRDRIGSNVDTKDAEAMARVKQLKSGFKAMSMEDVLRPIMSKEMDKKHPDYLAKHGLNTWRDAFSNYLGARRVLELLRIAQDKGITDYALPKGITEADLKAVVEHAPREFNLAAQRYYQLQRNMLILMEDGGLISKEVHDKINEMYKEYCPLMIDYSDTASIDSMLNNFARGADSIANVNSMLKYVLQEGSERGLISPLESTYAGINMLTDRAERNKVANHFVNMVEGNKDLQKSGILKRIEDKHGSDPKNCIFTVLIDGKKQAFQTTQDMYGPIVGFDTPAAGLAESLARNSAQILRAGATSSPSFIVRNFIRDTIFAGVSSRNGFVPIVDSVKGMMAYLHDKELRGEFDAMGITAFNFFGSGKAAVKSMDELMGDGKIHNFFDLVKAFFGKWQEASEIVEASTRMGEYMRARAAGKSMEEAALDARDVTLDFSRSGTSGRRMNMMVPFFNACIQGGDKMYRLLANKDPKVRMHTMRMLGLYIMLPSLFLWAINHDEPWYEELDPHIKMNNWILPGGIRIPKPQEAGVAFGSGLEAIMDKLSGKDPAAMKEWTKALKDVMLPNLIPTLILPLMEWQANYSYFREKAIEGKRLQRLPVEQRYNSGTSELSKAIGSAAGLSPVKLDNTLRGYTGTMGMLFAQIPDMFFEHKRNLPSKPITEKAFIRDFFLNDMNMNRTSEDFYDLVSAAQQQHAGYGKKGQPTAAVTAVNKALRDVSKQQKDIQAITNANNLSSDRKRELIDKKRAMIKQIQQATLKKYRDKFKV